MSPKNLVGAATRYIAGRNAVQTVYWRTQQGASNGDSLDHSRFVKVSRTFNFGRTGADSSPPLSVRQGFNKTNF